MSCVEKSEAQTTYNIKCTDFNCTGIYTGAEFINGEDIAHQLSNKISAAVGDQLKVTYKDKKYSKVDFDFIQMTTEGMGTGEVVYKVVIPFLRVDKPCKAYTSFDHVGGWNHKPALQARINQLKDLPLKGSSLDISDLKTTPEGLQEYWIQWKNSEVQVDCE